MIPLFKRVGNVGTKNHLAEILRHMLLQVVCLCSFWVNLPRYWWSFGMERKIEFPFPAHHQVAWQTRFLPPGVNSSIPWLGEL